jgi:hypothetical protein
LTAQASTGLRETLDLVPTERVRPEQIGEQLARRGCHDHGAGFGQSVQAAPPGWASRRPPPVSPTRSLADHDNPDGDADAHHQWIGNGNIAHRGGRPMRVILGPPKEGVGSASVRLHERHRPKRKESPVFSSRAPARWCRPMLLSSPKEPLQ